jgi:hypothetical protein
MIGRGVINISSKYGNDLLSLFLVTQRHLKFSVQNLSKTESRQCGPPYPDIAECMNDGSLHSDIDFFAF